MKFLPIDFSHPLVADAKLRCIFRFIKWQIKSRISKGDSIHNWVEVSKFYVRNGETGLTQNIYVGLAEFAEMSFLMHLLREEDQFIDIGANSGSYSILAGSIVGARTLAIEPIPSTYTRLVANLKLNCIESLSQTKCVGLGSSSGFLNMTRSLDPRNQIIFDENTNQSIQVKVETLDFVALGLSPTLIKIDVEGWELEVIRGGFNTLRNPSLVALIVELNESGERYGFLDCDIFEALKNFGFHPYTYDAFSRTVQKISGKNPDSGNTIFIRNVEEVARKIGTAPRREILGNWI